VSCYSKHPDRPGVECWHGPGHRGDHGKEDKSWPNLDDPAQIELKRLTDENAELKRQIGRNDGSPVAPVTGDIRSRIEAAMGWAGCVFREDEPGQITFGTSVVVASMLREFVPEMTDFDVTAEEDGLEVTVYVAGPRPTEAPASDEPPIGRT